MNLIGHWIRNFPEPQKVAIKEAFDSASLAKIRRAARLHEKLDPEQRSSMVDIEFVSTFNLEPVLPVLQLALDCLPSRAHLHLAPLDAIESHISQSETAPLQKTLHARVVVWRVEELFPELLYPFSSGFPKQLASRADEVVARIGRVVNLH